MSVTYSVIMFKNRVWHDRDLQMQIVRKEGYQWEADSSRRQHFA
jgi:hypothetical protein